MSTLARFRKPGGFLQLLALIESCDPDKQKSLLHLIAIEDPGWAALVKIKALHFETVIQWPQEYLQFITPHVPDQLAAIIASSIKNELQEKWIQSFTFVRSKNIKGLLATLQMTTSEKAASQVRLVQIVRELEASGIIRISEQDANLHIPLRLIA